MGVLDVAIYLRISVLCYASRRKMGMTYNGRDGTSVAVQDSVVWLSDLSIR